MSLMRLYTQNGVDRRWEYSQNPEEVPPWQFFWSQKRVCVLCLGRPPREIWLPSLEEQNTGQTVCWVGTPIEEK